MNALGRHILVEYINCSSDVLNDVALIENAMVEAAQKAGATVIQSSFHHFSPWGVSGVVVIQESHLAIHTWPEYGYAAVDLFTCGETVDPWISFDHLKKIFESSNQSAVEMYRGSLNLLQRIDFSATETLSQQRKDLLPKAQRSFWFTDKDENQAFSIRHTGEVLFQENSAFQKVRILQSLSHGRMLALNDMVMCTERDEAHYHEMIVHPVMQVHPHPKNVLVIGGGDGGTIRELFKYPIVEKVTMVEIDAAVIEASKKCLPTLNTEFNNPKLDLKIADGIQFAAEAMAESFDLVIVDGSDPVGPAEGLYSIEFFKNCQRILKPGGFVVSQGESPMFHDKSFVGLNKCLKEIFGQKSTHTLLFHATTYPTGMWSIQMASKKGPHPVADFKSEKTKQFCLDKGLKYYNEDLHLASFCLPTFVKRMLNEAH